MTRFKTDESFGSSLGERKYIERIKVVNKQVRGVESQKIRIVFYYELIL